jgi:membrane associated rhomboid family serine protease
MMMVVSILVILGAALYFTSAEERARLVRAIVGGVRQATGAAIRLRTGTPGSDPFAAALRTRTPWAVVTPVLVFVNTTIFVFMLFGAGTLSDPETVVSWGGNFGPSTTNGEWWRLVTAMFVHSGMLHLLANIAGLVQIGVIMERLFGRVAFAAVYIGAGLLSTLVSLAAHPMTVSAGASGAIFGIYGLWLAWLIAGWTFGSTLTIPLGAVRRLGPAAGVFVLYSVVAGFDGAGEIAGLAAGFAGGLVLARGVSERTTPALRVAFALAVVVAMAVVSATLLRGVANVPPEMERVAAIEGRTSTAYEAAVHRFRTGQVTMDTLAQLIDRTILPELGAARAHLKELGRVPRVHAPLVASADEYLRLREQSWRVRVEGLRKTNIATLRKADQTERAALEALNRIKPADKS